VEIELPDSDQTDITFPVIIASLFVSIEDYLLGGGNEDFEVYEKSFRESFSIQIMDTKVAGFSGAHWTGCLF